MKTRGFYPAVILSFALAGCAAPTAEIALAPVLTDTSAPSPTQPALMTKTSAPPGPTVDRAPCDGEATRTPTPAPTTAPTLRPGLPTLTPTSTTDAPAFLIPLRWPPNCAVLHTPTLPRFEFGGLGGPFVSRISVSGPGTGFRLEVLADELDAATPARLPDGVYFWQVTASRPSGAGRTSEVWQFTIDTTCSCTDTPVP